MARKGVGFRGLIEREPESRNSRDFSRVSARKIPGYLIVQKNWTGFKLDYNLDMKCFEFLHRKFRVANGMEIRRIC